MKIALVLNARNVYVKEIKEFMLEVCKDLGAEHISLMMDFHPEADICNEIEESGVDVVMISVNKEDPCPGVEIAGLLVQEGIESLLVQCYGEQSFNISPSYPFYTIEGPPDHRCKEGWYIKEVANDIRKGLFTQSGTVEAVIRKVEEAEKALKEAEDMLDEKKHEKAEAERFRDNYLQLLVKIHDRKERRMNI